ncbi:MAG: hypothetical protein Q9225_004452 [Loekoesia sp. 1 TL-2023]
MTQSALPRSQEDDIVELSDKCSKLAEDLLAELHKLRLKQSGLRHAIKKGFRAIRQRDSLKEKQVLLERYKSVLNTHILVRLDTRLLMETQDIRGLDQNIQDLVQALEKGHKTVEQLLANNSRQTQDHFDKKFESYTKTATDRFAHQRFLESLFFPEIESRQEQIPEAFEETCRWIFEPPTNKRSKDQRWSNFHDWLEIGYGVYWISGKPGSGKSTLMKYIVNEDLTMQLLDNWKRDKDLLTISFFFWNTGTVLQKSAAGLLRSLLYQIAKKWPELVNLTKMHPGKSIREIEISTPLFAAWTDRRLLSVLKTFLDQKPASVSLCAFIDGLDEFVGDEDLLLDMIRLFSEASQCKICVSSRPEQALRQEFELCPQLRIQDLNYDDIEKMANGKLIPSLQKHSCIVKDSDEVASLIRNLTEKASGVFLWLDLMINDLIRGARNGDTVQELQARLQRTPETINGVYAHILNNLDPLYQKKRLKYFGALLAAAELNYPVILLDLVCAEGEPWEHAIKFDLDYFATPRFNLICRQVEDQLIACCGDLIDIQDYLGDNEEEEKVNISHYDRMVNLVHRTAMEYVREKYKSDLLDPSSLVKANAYLARGGIGLLTLTSLTAACEHLCRRRGFAGRDFATLLRDTMSIISTLGYFDAVPGIGESSVLIQIDLTNQAFQSLQDLYTFHYHSEQDFFDDITCLKSFFRVYELGHNKGASSVTWCPINDRLSGAAFFGCNHYVQFQLSTRYRDIAEERVENLLQAALSGIMDVLFSRMAKPKIYSLPWFLTIQTVLQYCLDPEKPFLVSHKRMPDIEHGTLWGAFSVVLMWALAGALDRASDSAWLALETCGTKLVETFLSLGANPNTRIVHSYEVYNSSRDWSNDMYLEETPLALMEGLSSSSSSSSSHVQLLSELIAGLGSAGAVHRRRLLYIYDRHSLKYYSLYRSSYVQVERLNKALRSNWGLLDESSEKILEEITASFTTEDGISREEVISEITNSSLSF